MDSPVNHSPLGSTLVPGNGARAFGGSTVAALVRAAADEAVDSEVVSAVHAHFLAAADPSAAVAFTSRVLQRSGSFATVAVEAVQQEGVVATATVAFHRPRPSREHGAATSPPSYAPDGAPPASGGVIPALDAACRQPFDFRAADEHPTTGPDGRPVLRYWLRHRGPLATPLDQTAALAWASDLCLTRVADLEHEHSPGVRRGASLDHALWLHRPFDLAEWVLYETTSPAYADEVAFSSGRFFADGLLVASVAQQSLLRRVIPVSER